ncbi:hypothetical protein, partial [Paenibacillus gorillae]|uniref:hypothetical protein n=1 Tax=Paenibacillus gorillae TaxID=1243662 RepID=UPI001EE1C9E0
FCFDLFFGLVTISRWRCRCAFWFVLPFLIPLLHRFHDELDRTFEKSDRTQNAPLSLNYAIEYKAVH